MRRPSFPNFREGEDSESREIIREGIIFVEVRSSVKIGG